LTETVTNINSEGPLRDLSNVSFLSYIYVFFLSYIKLMPG